MILCLDVGNSHIYGGLFDGDNLCLQFRHTTSRGTSSDQLGIFLKSVLRENNFAEVQVKDIAICSVVPSVDYSLRSACRKYFEIDPFFLQAGVKTGLKINYQNPVEVGADRIANAIAAAHQFPKQNVMIIDLGTATTFCAVTAEREYLGGGIQAGIRLSMEALQINAAKLPSVEIVKPPSCLGRSTRESIQVGLYYGQLGSIREMTKRLSDEVFAGQQPVMLGTGGFSHLFQEEGLFTTIVPELVLHGLRIALTANR